MIQKIFAVHDSKAKVFFPPFMVPHGAVALRSFKNMVDDPTTQIGRNPEDFTLFELGTFDDETGTYVLLTPMLNHGQAVNYRKE